MKKKDGIGCTCGKIAKPVKGLKFNGHTLDGWKCKCGQIYYDPEQSQTILFLNKLKKKKFHLKLSQVRSNLVLRIPKQVGEVLGLKKGDEVEFSVKDGKMVIES